MTRPEMTRAEVREILRANIGKQLYLAFDNGTVQSVEIGPVGDKGFFHSGDGAGLFWAGFDEVKQIHRKVPAVSTPGSGPISGPKWVTVGLRRKRKSLSRSVTARVE